MNLFLNKLLLPFLLVSVCAINGCSGQGTSANSPVKNEVAKKAEVIDTTFHNGDIIFQTSQSGQSYAIQLATHSMYSHCGLLFKDDGQWYVYEAVQPVMKTPLKKWIARGDSGIFVVKRLKDADSLLTENVMKKMRKSVHDKMGKNYDAWFGWSNERIYCSELVWKAYNDATGLEVGKLKKLGEYDLSHPIVKKIMFERYGNKVPYDEPMISPGNIFESDLLVLVRKG
jgi:uncharacterized protein YycO